MYHTHRRRFPHSAFTLIELLVVIAIIAILAVVVVLTLNPAQLLAQSRDANRLSDLSTLNSAINLYNVDVSGGSGYSLGAASTTYISFADLSAATTAGTNCGTLGLPATTTGWSFHCAASSTLRSVNNLGWIPVNFAAISAGTPFGNLPVDPTNNTSSLFYYTYQTTGSTYEITVPLESSKYIKQNLLVSNPDPTRVAMGSAPFLVPQGEGLMGYWNFDEGSGSSTLDLSGNNNTGTWGGTATGTSNTYYTAGRVGSYAGAFDGNTTYVQTPTLSIDTNISFGAWVWSTNLLTMNGALVSKQPVNTNWELLIGGGNFIYRGNDNTNNFAYPIPVGSNNGWHHVFITVAGSFVKLYFDGIKIGDNVHALMGNGTGVIWWGKSWAGDDFNGFIDDARIYNRTLSPAEVQGLYNAEK